MLVVRTALLRHCRTGSPEQIDRQLEQTRLQSIEDPKDLRSLELELGKCPR